MRDDLTYRQQRKLSLIAEALLTGRTDLLEQVDREALMLNEQMGMGGRRTPKLTIDTPVGSGPIDVDVAGAASGQKKANKVDLLGGLEDLLKTIAAIPGDVVDFVDDNVTAEILKAFGIKPKEGTGGGIVTPEGADRLAYFLLSLILGGAGGGGGGPTLPGGGGGGVPGGPGGIG